MKRHDKGLASHGHAAMGNTPWTSKTVTHGIQSRRRNHGPQKPPWWEVWVWTWLEYYLTFFHIMITLNMNCNICRNKGSLWYQFVEITPTKLWRRCREGRNEEKELWKPLSIALYFCSYTFALLFTMENKQIYRFLKAKNGYPMCHHFLTHY